MSEGTVTNLVIFKTEEEEQQQHNVNNNNNNNTSKTAHVVMRFKHQLL